MKKKWWIVLIVVILLVVGCGIAWYLSPLREKIRCEKEYKHCLERSRYTGQICFPCNEI